MPPPDLSDHPRKRPRPVISCQRCREKRLKCDRVSPCQNCSKAGSLCVFQHGAKRPRLESGGPTTVATTDQGSSAGIGVIEDLQRRLRRVEELLAVRSESENPRCDAPVGSQNQSQSQSQSQSQTAPPHAYPGILVVKGSRTRYHGPNNRSTLLNRFDGARDIISECTKDTSIFRVAKEVQFLQRKASVAMGLPESVSEQDFSVELQQLERLLPPAEVCDKLLGLYTTTFEQTFRILHVPTFYRQYTTFLGRLNGDRDKSPAFVPQLTAILAAAFPLLRVNTSKALLINLVRAWLSKLARKQQTEIETLQSEALVLLARSLRVEPAEELWQASGLLVRSAMVMGLHLDLTTFPDLSVHQKEVRRRLWSTIVEMDLQASIASAMPTSFPDINFRPLGPTNIDDLDYDEGTTELPPSKPLSEWTDSLAQVTLASSLTIRIRAMSLAQMPGFKLDPTEVLELGRGIETSLRQTPPSLKPAAILSSNVHPSRLLSQLLVNLYIRRPLISLYQCIASKTRGQESNPEVQDTLLACSLSILSYQECFDPAVSDLDFHNPPDYWQLFQTLCRNDVLQAALTVCSYVKLAPAPWHAAHAKDDLLRTVENALHGMVRTLHQPGSDMKDVVLLAVVLNLVRAQGSEKAQKELVKQAIITIMTACREHLTSSSVTDALLAQDTNRAAQSVRPDPCYMQTSFPQVPDFLDDDPVLAAEFSSFMDGPLGFADGFVSSLFSSLA
ncbi:hypothetical protein BJX76DRAFT_349254 [Aspergillus varians]